MPSATKAKASASPPPGRTSKLNLPLQKELVLDILSNGGLYQCKITDIISKKADKLYGTTNKADPIGQAVLAKVYNCKRSPEIWERLQIRTLGRVVEEPRVLKEESTPPQTVTPSRITSPNPVAFVATPPLYHQVSFSAASPPLPSSPLKSRASFQLSSPITDLVSSLSTMSFKEGNSFGTTSPPHREYQVDPVTGHTERDFQIMITPKVTFGTTPAYCCSVVTFLLSNIDKRWLKKLPVKFVPFKMTQVAKNAVVFESPCAHYDFFFGPRMNENNGYNKEELKEVFLVSDEKQEQIQYEMQRKVVLSKSSSANPNEYWRTRTRYTFDGVELDFSAIDPKARNGEIRREFVFGPNPSLKWRIAFKPTAADLLRDEEEEEDDLEDDYAQFEQLRQEALEQAEKELGEL